MIYLYSLAEMIELYVAYFIIIVTAHFYDKARV